MGSKRDKLKRAVRKTVKWGGLVVTVLLLGVWVGSVWWWAEWQTVDGGVQVRWGRIEGYKLPPNEVPDFMTTFSAWLPHAKRIKWGFEWRASQLGATLVIPLWPLPLLSLLATAAAWRADSKYLRRARVGMCPACGYDRAGLAAGVVCPECGAAAAGGVVRARKEHAPATDTSKAEKE